LQINSRQLSVLIGEWRFLLGGLSNGNNCLEKIAVYYVFCLTHSKRLFICYFMPLAEEKLLAIGFLFNIDERFNIVNILFRTQHEQLQTIYFFSPLGLGAICLCPKGGSDIFG
jgi:hypothetical protein